MTKSDHRIAICPGSFDPITRGHEDIVRRALRFSDRVIVAISHRPSQTKKGLFEVSERLEMVREVFAEEPAIAATTFDGLLVDFAREQHAALVVRGLRSVLDFEYEWQMALMNRELDPRLETVFLAPSAEISFLSSSLVREVATMGGDVTPFVSKPVLRRIHELGSGG